MNQLSSATGCGSAARLSPARQANLGWGFGKLDVVTEPSDRPILLLDSDTVFAGRVLDSLTNFSEDSVVEDFDEPDTASQWIFGIVTFEARGYQADRAAKINSNFAPVFRLR